MSTMTIRVRYLPVLALALLLLAPSSAHAQTWTSPLGQVYPIPGFAQGIFDRIPDAQKEKLGSLPIGCQRCRR